jgi:uracil-DNA glycosylase family 4
MRSAGLESRELRPVDPRSGAPWTIEFGPAWLQLEREIRACERCSLHASRTNAVVYRGSPSPRIVFVGEAPGATEDRQGVPFVGRSGKLLDAAISEARIGAEDFGILNVVKCRPPKNRFDPAAASTCRPYLERQLALLQPAILVSLGAHALRALDPSAPRVMLAAGRPRPLEQRVLFPLIHPAAALRSRSMAERWRSDIGSLGTWLAGPNSPSSRESS